MPILATGMVLVLLNKPNVNRNGELFLDFLNISNCVHVNGLDNLTKGLWTRQRSGFSSIIDYGVVGREHISSVLSMFIDDQGHYGGGSDHNWIFMDLADRLVKKLRKFNLPNRRPS